MPAVGPTEAQFTKMVTDLARLRGWLVYHALPLRTAKGWATGTMGDAGWPDVVACGHGRLVVAELKVGRNKPTAAQEAWLAALRAVPGVEVYVWRPDNWPMIDETFTEEG